MNKSFVHFTKLQDLLGAIWPHVANIQWNNYGTKILAYDDVNVPKHTGIIAHFAAEPVLGSFTQVEGFLPRPEKSARTVVNKIQLLKSNASHTTSLELREPSENKWGGAIRLSISSNWFYSLSGLPEIGDHLLNAQMQLACKMISCEQWRYITRHDSPYMFAAREDVDMSRVMFEELRCLISKIVTSTSMSYFKERMFE